MCSCPHPALTISMQRDSLFVQDASCRSDSMRRRWRPGVCMVQGSPKNGGDLSLLSRRVIWHIRCWYSYLLPPSLGRRILTPTPLRRASASSLTIAGAPDSSRVATARSPRVRRSSSPTGWRGRPRRCGVNVGKPFFSDAPVDSSESAGAVFVCMI